MSTGAYLPLPLSSSSSTPRQKFEVFLSFYGKDTRFNFTDHLYKALKGKGIDVFRDDEEIERGEDISQELLDAIHGSQFAIVVLSKDYALSKWCLAELSEIVKCRKKQLTIFPVFYHVDPSDVRNQTGSFAIAFDEHRKNPKVGERKRKTWADALKQVGNIAGCHVKDRYDTTVIGEIIDWVFGKLTRNLPNVSTKLFGMESRVKEIITLLDIGGGGVRFLGFHGMGGVGKTTLAEAVFHQISSEFDASCFIACDGEAGKRGLVSLQEELIHKTLMEREPNIYNPSEGKRLIKARLQKGTDAVEAIVLKLPLHKEEPLSVEAFSKMNGLRMLEISNIDSKISFSRSRAHLNSLKWHGTTSNFMLSNELCVLEWWGYPLECLLPSFQPDNLVELIMRHSHIKKLWDGQKSLEKLKRIDLIDSKSLEELPDFGGVPNIEELVLAYCTSLCKVHKSIGFLKQLKCLDLRGCISLERLVDTINLPLLEDLNLRDCSMLNEFLDILGDMTSLKLLDLTRTAIIELPPSFERLSSLVHFSVSHCLRFREIPESLSGMQCLEHLYAEKTGIMVFPTYVFSLKKLRVLKVGGSDSNTTSFVLPKLFYGLGSLRELDLSYRNLSNESMPDDLRCLSSIESLNLSGNKITMIPNLCLGLSPLRKLHLSDCNLLDGALPNDLSSLPSLQFLDLSGNKFKKIPDSISQLSDLHELYLEDCCQLEVLPKLPLRLGYLYLSNCKSLKTFHNELDAFTSSDTLRTIDFSFVAAYIDYDGKPYKTLHLHQQSPLWVKSKAESFDTLVACGLGLESGIPNWFSDQSTQCHLDLDLDLDMELDFDEDLEALKGYALFIDFQVNGQEVHEQESSNSRISDGISLTFPYFLCQFQTDNVTLREPLVLCIPKVSSVGRNGFWAYIPAEWFGEQRNNLDGWSCLRASIAISGLTVERIDYGLRPIRQCDLREFYEVLHSISPHGLSLGNWKNLLFCLHEDLKALKVQGPIHGTVSLASR